MSLPLSTLEKDGGDFLKQKEDNLGVGGELKNLKVFADILVDPQQLLMVNVAASLKAIEYEIELSNSKLGDLILGYVLMGLIGYVSDESGLSAAAIEPVPESCVSTIEDKKFEDIEKWWKMGLKAISDGKLVVLLLYGGRTCIVLLLY
ncbi:hypothetical protein L6452_28327 [Arctium lappa]|uniref:Uncharacterized protein n=1 Tax=Arctium lappa TaxID=4217 RepID=A0ACB8ZY59_ARCLA|nr:hypothetical protein L6452_28327 [Arctium lappa]